jgi:hypothetical protein
MRSVTDCDLTAADWTLAVCAGLMEASDRRRSGHGNTACPANHISPAAWPREHGTSGVDATPMS